MKLGVDLSTYFDELAHGALYRVANEEVDPLPAFAKNGVDLLRIRIWVDPEDENGASYLGGGCDLENALRLSHIAKPFGYKTLLDLHYSDFWCDPGKQMKPKAWINLDFESLKKAVYEHTKTVLLAYKKEDLPLEGIQIGNEITNGILWPDGHLEGEVPHRTNYERLIALLASGIKAVRELYPSLPVALHLEKSGDEATYHEFFDEMEKAHLDYQIIALSYYPYWHGTFQQVFANIESLKKYHKDIQVVELGYAYTLEDYEKGHEGQLVVSEENLKKLGCVNEFPFSQDGQAEFVSTFLKEAESHGVSAVYYWEPAWIPLKGAGWASLSGQRYIGTPNPKESRNEWSNQCLFDYDGKATKAYDAFALKALNKKETTL